MAEEWCDYVDAYLRLLILIQMVCFCNQLQVGEFILAVKLDTDGELV